MENQSKKSPEPGISINSNFFNESEQRLNPNALFINCSQPGLASVMEKIVLDESKLVNNPDDSPDAAAQNIAIKPRYGNHRNKTTRGFERSNYQLALLQKQRQTNRYYKGKEVQCMQSQDHFQSYSPGIYLFFTFLKKISILFLILSLLYSIPIIYNYLNGNGLSNAANTFQVMVAKTMVGNQYNNGSSDQSLKDKLLIILPDEIAIIIFLGFYLYWCRFSNKFADQNKDKFKRISRYTVQVTNFAADLTQDEVQKHFQQYGQVQQVAAVKNYEQMIDLSKQLYELCLQIKQKILSAKDKDSQEYTKFLTQKQNKANKLFNKLAHVQESRQKKNIKFYVRFQEQQSKLKVLKDYQPFNKFCCCFKKQVPEYLKINKDLPKVKSCDIQPTQIIWENIHIKRKSRILRFFIQFILILAIIALGFILITTINISTPPTSYSNIQTGNLTLTNVKDANLYSLSYTWCLSKSTFTTDQATYCQSYLKSYYYRLALSVGITFVILIIKMILKNIMIAIAYFQRYKNHTQLSTNVMTNLFVIYITTTVMITFLMQANIFGISFKSILEHIITNTYLKNNLSSISEYNDFITFWYKDIGYQIWLNWLILSIFPHPIMPLYYLIKQKIGQKMAKKQVLQKNVKKWLQAQQFQIEDNYANILMLIFVGFVFSGGIPFMSIFTFIGLSTRYIFLKYIFIRFCKIPNYYTDAINDRAKLILQISLIVHMCMSIWMFGVTEILGTSDQIKILADTNNISKGLVIIVNKLSANWYLSGIMVLIILALVFYKVVIETIVRSCRRQNNQQQNKQTEADKKVKNLQPKSGQDELKFTIVSRTQSYKIEKNPNYFEILAIMKPEDVINTQQLNALFPFINLSQLNKSIKPS